MSAGGGPELRCASCGHLRIEHDHQHSQTYCSHPHGGGRYCQCSRFAHPVAAWAHHLWDRVTERLSRG